MDSSSYFIDSNVFIYVLLKDPRHGRTALDILMRMERGEQVGVTSTLVLSQVLGHLSRRKAWTAMEKFLEYVESSPIIVVETLAEDFHVAREMLRRKRLPWRLWDDLVIAAQMLRVNVSKIYSNDSDFDLIGDVERVFI